MESWQRELKKYQQALAEAEQKTHCAWITLADEYYRLMRMIEHLSSVLEQDGHSREAEDCRLMIRRLEQVLREGGVECFAPVGEPYTVEMSDFLTNLGQQVRTEIPEPTVLEVIEPVIRQYGEIIRPGKAIIAVPVVEKQEPVER
jgi:hypothetical protein